jgi:hypothetical protein
MSHGVREFVRAANEAAKQSSRAGEWAYWERYDVVETGQGDGYVVAPADADYERYRPLQVDGLFLEFARLADEGEITREVWLDWVKRYGVLGLQWRDPNALLEVAFFGAVCEEGGPLESHRNFVREARRANLLLRLVESVDSLEGPDYPKFSKELYEIYSLPVQGKAAYMPPNQAKAWALRTVWEAVEEQIRECYPVVLTSHGRFVQGWGFHSLISAMYLQLMWLLTAIGDTGEAVRWCKRPECSKVVAYEQPELPTVQARYKKNDRSMGYRIRSDKAFCSDRCKGLYHYHYRKKGRRGSEE